MADLEYSTRPYRKSQIKANNMFKSKLMVPCDSKTECSMTRQVTNCRPEIHDQYRIANLINTLSETEIKCQSLASSAEHLKALNQSLAARNRKLEQKVQKAQYSREKAENVLKSNEANSIIKELKFSEIQKYLQVLENKLTQLMETQEAIQEQHKSASMLSLANELRKLTDLLPKLSLQVEKSFTAASTTLLPASLSFNQPSIVSIPNADEQTNMNISNIASETKILLKDASTSPDIERMNRIPPKSSKKYHKKSQPSGNRKRKLQQSPVRFGDTSTVLNHEPMVDLTSTDASLLFANENSMLLPLESLVLEMQRIRLP